jgi:toxin HigB-1
LGEIASVPEKGSVPETLGSFNLHPLKGDLKGFYAVTVRAYWPLIYRFENGNAYDVSLIDYH